MSTTTATEVIPFNLAGKALRMVPLTSAKGNTYFATVRAGQTKMSPYGVQIPALAKSLPSKVQIGGTNVPLVEGETTTGNAKRSASFPTEINGQPFQVTIQVSRTKGGHWNLIAKAIPPGGGGGANVVDLDGLA